MTARARTPQRRRYSEKELALLHQAGELMHEVAAQLRRMQAPFRPLMLRLQDTEAYRSVDGIDDGADDPVWLVTWTLHSMLDTDLEHTILALLRGADRARAAVRAAARHGAATTLARAVIRRGPRSTPRAAHASRR